MLLFENWFLCTQVRMLRIRHKSVVYCAREQQEERCFLREHEPQARQVKGTQKSDSQQGQGLTVQGPVQQYLSEGAQQNQRSWPVQPRVHRIRQYQRDEADPWSSWKIIPYVRFKIKASIARQSKTPGPRSSQEVNLQNEVWIKGLEQGAKTLGWA